MQMLIMQKNSFHKELRYCIAHFHMLTTACSWFHVSCCCSFEICILTKLTKSREHNERFSMPSLRLWCHVVSLMFSDFTEEHSASISDWRWRQDIPPKWCTHLQSYMVLQPRGPHAEYEQPLKLQIPYRLNNKDWLLVNLWLLRFQALPHSLTIRYRVTLVAVCQAYSDVGWGMWALPWSVAYRVLHGPPKTPWMKMDKLGAVEQNLVLP